MSIKTVLFFPFQSDVFSFSCLTALTRTSSMILNSSGESTWGKALSLSSLSMYLTIGFLWISFIRLRKFFHSWFPKRFYHGLC